MHAQMYFKKPTVISAETSITECNGNFGFSAWPGKVWLPSIIQQVDNLRIWAMFKNKQKQIELIILFIYYEIILYMSTM